MAKASASIILIFLVVLVGKFMETKAKGPSCDYLDKIGGGCPDVNACGETCRPCYRGIGRVEYSCVAPGGGILFWRCRCEFKNGAPCPPVGPPTCPAPGAAAALESHGKIGGHQTTDVKFYYNHDKNVTENILSHVRQFP